MKGNEMKQSHVLVGTALSAMLLPSAAFAHPGIFHHHTLLTGLEHPLSGVDHILAMTSVGLWASQKGGRALWVWPAAFVVIMLFGGFLGMEGIALPLVEPAIAASILVLGLMIASAAMLPMWAGALLIGAFALFHGNAHGLEAPATGASLLYALGFAASTASLHVAGLAVGLASNADGWRKFVRVGGALTAGIGGTMLFV
jgi:urease accessory protein